MSELGATRGTSVRAYRIFHEFAINQPAVVVVNFELGDAAPGFFFCGELRWWWWW